MEDKTFSRWVSSRKQMLLVQIFMELVSRTKNLTYFIIFDFMKHKHWSVLVYVNIWEINGVRLILIFWCFWGDLGYYSRYRSPLKMFSQNVMYHYWSFVLEKSWGEKPKGFWHAPIHADHFSIIDRTSLLVVWKERREITEKRDLQQCCCALNWNLSFKKKKKRFLLYKAISFQLFHNQVGYFY